MSTSQDSTARLLIKTDANKKDKKSSTPRSKRNRSKSKTGLTPEDKRATMSTTRRVVVEAKLQPEAKSPNDVTDMEGTEPPVKGAKLSATELRIFRKGENGEKTSLSKTDWRKVKDELNMVYAEMEQNNGMMEGLKRHVYNGTDPMEKNSYGVFVYKSSEQAEKMAELFPLLKLSFGIVMEIPGKNAPSSKPMIEMPMHTNKNVAQAKLLVRIREQNNLQGKFLNGYYKDTRTARIYTLEPCPKMIAEIKQRNIEEFAFGLDVFKIYTKNF